MFSRGFQQINRRLEATIRALSLSLAVAVIGSVAALNVSAQPPEVPVHTYNLGSTVSQSCSDSITCSTWVAFRTAHPWPFQAYVVSAKAGEAVVIVSEPPPSLTRQQLTQAVRALFGSDLLDLEYHRWPTGIDGWLEDLVARVRLQNSVPVRVMSDNPLDLIEAPGEIVDRLHILHRLQYKTATGFWLTDLTPSANPPAIKELQFRANELGSWTVDDKNSWTQEGRSASGTNVRDILTVRSPGVFTREGGLVAFVAPNGVKLAELEEPFRIFAVSTDLILGAASLKGGGLALLGRERQLSLSLLPPLRFETLSAFARNRATEVAQSYERQRIFAGRIREGQYRGWDWAPVLLSSQLDDSEYGTLLNFADQILKSWSQHGQVEYYAFPYRKPENYPFGEESASDFFSHRFLTSSLVFNWNTDGFSTIEQTAGRDVLLPDRTGALSILYRPSGGLFPEDLTERPLDSEDLYRNMQRVSDAAAHKARDFFATRGDPLLVRVVQNTLLYQAVQSFLKVADQQDPPRTARSDGVLAVLKKQASAWLARVTGMPADPGIDPEIRIGVANLLRRTGLSQLKLAEFIASPQNAQQEILRDDRAFRSKIDQISMLEKTMEEVSAREGQEFIRACRALGGTLTPTQSGARCEWTEVRPSLTFSTSNPAFAQYHRLETELEHDKVRLKLLKSETATLVNAISAKEKAYTEAQRFARTLSEHAKDTNLDSVLSAVLAGTADRPSSGSIRTPSVVLSRNTDDVFAVGGHNISLSPTRIGMPGSPRPTSVGGIKSTRTRLMLPTTKPEPVETRPIRSPEVALQTVPRKNSLLHELVSAEIRAVARPERMAWATERARTCNCDALVIQDEGGTVLFVRNQPPPVQRAIFGKSGVIDALAGPPRPKVVRFENFSPESVQGIANTVSLASTVPRRGAIDGVLNDVASAFMKSETRVEGVSMLVERSGNRRDVVHIEGEQDALASFNHHVAWNTGRVDPASTKTWTDAFGEDQPLENPEGAIIVRFGGRAPLPPSTLGIQVDVVDAKRPGISARLAEVVRTWLATRRSVSSPWLDGIAELRATIRRQLQPRDLKFFYERNAKRIRAAELILPDGPRRIACRRV